MVPWLIALGAVAVGSVGAVVLEAPLVAGAAFLSFALVLAGLRAALPPGWVIVGLLYVLAPLGALFRQIDSSGLVLVSALMMILPFVVSAVVTSPNILGRLPLLAPFVALVALGLASLTWSPAGAYGLDKLILWITTGIIPAGFVLVLASASRYVGWSPIVLGATATAAATLLFADTSSYPPTLFDTNPIWASRGAFIGVLVVLFVRFPMVVKVIAIPIMVVAGVSTASLGPLLGFVAGLVAGAVVALRHGGLGTRRVALGWAGLLGGLVTAGIVVVSGVADPLLASVYDDPNVEARVRYLEVAWNAFLDAPLGIGIGGFASFGQDEYPHNVYVEVGLELGFAGLAVLIWWVAVSLRAAAGSPPMVALVVATSAFALFSGSLGSSTEFWLFSMLAVASSPLLRPAASAP